MRYFYTMKRIIAVILTVIYSALSSGAMVSLHYCGGEVESIRINSEAQSCCCSAEDFHSDCCENEEFVLHIDLDENLVIASNNKIELLTYIVFSDAVSELFSETEKEEQQSINYTLPPPKSEPIWLMNCTFTFYG